MDEEEYNKRMKYLAPIAFPVASIKLCPKVLKLCKKATKAKQVKRGVKEVVKAIRKKQKGLVILAGDISPIDVITHVPVLCEDNNIPYVYVPAKEYLANASETRRPTSCLMVLPKPLKPPGSEPDESFSSLYKKVEKKLLKLETMPS